MIGPKETFEKVAYHPDYAFFQPMRKRGMGSD
jgi:hypothetical protein